MPTAPSARARAVAFSFLSHGPPPFPPPPGYGWSMQHMWVLLDLTHGQPPPPPGPPPRRSPLVPESIETPGPSVPSESSHVVDSFAGSDIYGYLSTTAPSGTTATTDPDPQAVSGTDQSDHSAVPREPPAVKPPPPGFQIGSLPRTTLSRLPPRPPCAMSPPRYRPTAVFRPPPPYDWPVPPGSPPTVEAPTVTIPSPFEIHHF